MIPMMKFDKDELQRLYQYGLSLSRDVDFSYDLVQSTVERCLRHGTQPDNQLAYARTVLRNIFLDHYRHQSKVIEEPYEDEVVSLHLEMQSLEQVMIARDELDKVWDLLKPFEAEILFLWAVEGYSIQEVADQIGIPKGTALARVHRLRIRLKDLMNGAQRSDTA